jgi:hypothetical protein
MVNRIKRRRAPWGWAGGIALFGWGSLAGGYGPAPDLTGIGAGGLLGAWALVRFLCGSTTTSMCTATPLCMALAPYRIQACPLFATPRTGLPAP